MCRVARNRLGDELTGSLQGGERDCGFFLNIYEPAVLGSACLDPEFAIGFGIPDVGGTDAAVAGSRLEDSDTTPFEGPPCEQDESQNGDWNATNDESQIFA